MTDRTRHHRHSLFSILALGVFLSGCMTTRAAPAAPEPMFNSYEVITGTAESQTILPGFLLGGPMADLAVVNIDENDDRRLHIYAFGAGAWGPRLDATLRPEVVFVDVGRIGGRDRLVTYERFCHGMSPTCAGRLNWFDPVSATERALVPVASSLSPPSGGEIPHVDITRDVNGDDRDDLVVPDIDGFWVFIQVSDGAFADPVKIGPSFKMSRLYEADGYRHDPWSQGRIHEMDYNRDGRSDLVFWNKDHFEVHHQDEHGLFATAAGTFTTDVEFDSDDLASLAAPHGVRRRRMDHNPSGDMTGRVLHSMTDLNRDGVADLVVFSLGGGGLWRMHSTYEVHFGTPAPGATVFAPDVGTAIQSDGIPFGIGQHDFDQDGQTDMTLTVLNLGIFKIIGMLINSLLTDSVSMELGFYRMEDGVYSSKPSATRTIKSHSFGKSGERASHLSSMLIGDVNGDGRSDLLLQNGPEGLRVFPGVPGPDLFARRPQKVAVAMPHEEYTRLVDLNKDGKQDILMHHPSTTEPHRLTMLIAR